MGAGFGLDIALVLVLIGYFVYGWRVGFARSAFLIAGIIAGGVAAFFIAPLIGQWVPWPEWRVAAIVAAAIALVIAGNALGATIGFAVAKRMAKSPLRTIDRAVGAIATTVATALVASVLAASVGTLGMPFLTAAVGESVTLRTINQVTPDPVEAWLAQARTYAVDEGIPLIVDALGAGVAAPPVVDAGTPALTAAAQSVVRITGTAYACGQSQSGSGFVVAADRVVTNAHVVAGVDEPVVESPTGQVLTGRVVYFDATDDLAVIAVDGLSARPLSLSPALEAGATGVVAGYPFGGPFSSTGAEVVSVATIGAPNIYNTESNDREVYTLAATVNQGNSGGPLLAENGDVAGVVFARSADNSQIGYAMTNTELSPVVTTAPTLDAPVPSGTCITGTP
jgi:S1-C subfamily serine protease